MNIAVAFNQKYIPYAYVMLTSLFENNKHRSVSVYVLCNNIPDEELMVFEELEKKYGQCIQAIEVSNMNILDSLPHTEEWTIEVYYRLMLQDILPADVDRVLYLDVDVIINGKLDGLYDLDFDDSYLIVNRDMSVKKCGLCEKQVKLFAHHESDHNEFPYFNAGIMLINLNKIRQEYTFEDFIRLFFERIDNILAQEQDLLNDLFYNKVKFVDENIYDLFAKIAYNEGLDINWIRDNTVIIHYAGGKPWSFDSYRYDTELIWWEYAKLTPFYWDMLEQTFWGEMKHGYCDSQMKKITKENQELLELTLKIRDILPKLV